MKAIILNKPKVFLSLKTSLGEGPIWNHKTQELSFVDIMNNKFFIWRKGKLRKYSIPFYISCLLPIKKNNWVSASENKIIEIKKNKKKIIYCVIKTIKEKLHNRFNDGKCDSEGRIWLSSMNKKEVLKSGKLFFFNKMLKQKIKLKKFKIGNGIDWSPDDKKMYFVASDKREVYSFNYNKKDGSITNKKIIIKVPKQRGYPDGICIDSLGFIWIAYWDGKCVIRHFPNGEIQRVIKLPIKRPTSLCFGGKKLNKLFITSAKTSSKIKNNLDRDSGKIFVIQTNIKGKKINFYKK